MVIATLSDVAPVFDMVTTALGGTGEGRFYKIILSRASIPVQRLSGVILHDLRRMIAPLADGGGPPPLEEVRA